MDTPSAFTEESWESLPTPRGKDCNTPEAFSGYPEYDGARPSGFRLHALICDRGKRDNLVPPVWKVASLDYRLVWAIGTPFWGGDRTRSDLRDRDLYFWKLKDPSGVYAQRAAQTWQRERKKLFATSPPRPRIIRWQSGNCTPSTGP